jgi:hypothetical protein
MGGDAAGSAWNLLAESVKLFLEQLEADQGLRDRVRISAVTYDDRSRKVFTE